MAKSQKSRKPAPRAPVFSRPALRATAIRVGAALAVAAVGLGVYAWRERGAPVASRDESPVVTAAAPEKSAPVEPPHASQPETPRREGDADNYKPMTVAMRATFDAWLMTTYAKCWRAPKTLPDGDPYLPKVRVAYREDGQLAAPPKLVNPPSDPAWKPHAEAALKAVKGCDPLHVPDKYADYYPSWKSRTVYFDPTRN